MVIFHSYVKLPEGNVKLLHRAVFLCFNVFYCFTPMLWPQRTEKLKLMPLFSLFEIKLWCFGRTMQCNHWSYGRAGSKHLIQHESSMCLGTEKNKFHGWFWPVTIWLFNIAMENGPFKDGLPIKTGNFPWRTVSHNQMVRDVAPGPPKHPLHQASPRAG